MNLRVQSTNHIFFYKRFWNSNLIPLIILLFLNIFVFYDHYKGTATFPWDFLGGYHTHSFGWYNHSSIFSQVKWFPWTNLGFPSAIAIQAGSWYIPLILIDLFGFTYSVETATKIQCLHAFLGSIGFYLFLRLFNFEKNLCLLGSICFQLSSLFFSNQQHVDIIRAYALLPWVLWAFHPAILNKRKFSLLIPSIILFQFFIVSYPGIIVSSAYGCLFYCIFNYFNLSTSDGKYKYIFNIFLTLTSSVLMSMVKWLPFTMYINLLTHGKVDVNSAPFYPIHLLTLFFNYDNPAFPSDITMRSLYVPMVTIVGIFFLKKNNNFTFRIGLSFILIAFFFGAFLHTLYPNRIPFLPGINLSRFPLSDWRPIFQIGIILLSIVGWNNIIKEEFSNKQVLCRIFLFCIFIMTVIWVALPSGFEPSNIHNIIVKSTLILSIIFPFFYIHRKITKHIYTNYNIFIYILIALSVIEGVYYHKNQEIPWKTPWNKNIESTLYQLDTHDSENKKQVTTNFNRRDERFVLNINNDFMTHRNNSIYNKCWYNESYCLLGYDNLKFSKPHAAIFSKAVENNNFFNFLINPQQILLIKEGEEFDINNFKLENNKNEFISNIDGVKASILHYRSNEILYKISTPASVQVIENEIWWDGWNVKICNNNICKDVIPSSHTKDYLRTWLVPPGDWDVYIFFQPKGVLSSYIFFFSGLSLVLLAGFIRKSNQKTP